MGGLICGSMVGHFWTFLLKPPQPLMGLFLAIPGPFEYFSENGWSQKISFLDEGMIVTPLSV